MPCQVAFDGLPLLDPIHRLSVVLYSVQVRILSKRFPVCTRHKNPSPSTAIGAMRVNDFHAPIPSAFVFQLCVYHTFLAKDRSIFSLFSHLNRDLLCSSLLKASDIQGELNMIFYLVYYSMLQVRSASFVAMFCAGGLPET